jgi:hypothetical protein
MKGLDLAFPMPTDAPPKRCALAPVSISLVREDGADGGEQNGDLIDRACNLRTLQTERHEAESARRPHRRFFSAGGAAAIQPCSRSVAGISLSLSDCSAETGTSVVS